MTNILILGHKGMLGHMVYKVLSDSYEIKTINERFPNWNKELFDGIDSSYDVPPHTTLP